jgi:hypothetical protein
MRCDASLEANTDKPKFAKRSQNFPGIEFGYENSGDPRVRSRVSVLVFIGLPEKQRLSPDY